MPKTTQGGNVEPDEQPQAGGEPETTTTAAESPTEKQDAALEGLEPDADAERSGARDLSSDEDRERLMLESVALPGQPMVLDRDGPEYGYVGQVPAQPPNEAYTFNGVGESDEAAKADRQASNPRIFRGSLYPQD
jgi:hypothetical protein